MKCERSGNSYVSVSASELRYFFAFDRITEGGMLVTVVVEVGAPDTEAIEAAITNELGAGDDASVPRRLVHVEVEPSTSPGSSGRRSCIARPDGKHLRTADRRLYKQSGSDVFPNDWPLGRMSSFADDLLAYPDMRTFTTDMASWPPPRIAACWCGSGRRYEHCCRRHGLGALD